MVSEILLGLVRFGVDTGNQPWSYSVLALLEQLEDNTEEEE